MRTKEQIIELIREGKLVVKTNGDFVNAGVLVDILEREHSGEDVEYNYIGLRYSYEDNMYYYFDDERIILNREIITLQEYLDSPSLSEVDKCFEGSREYDEKLLWDWFNAPFFANSISPEQAIQQFLNYRYKKTDLLKEKEQLEQRLKEINEQLKGN